VATRPGTARAWLLGLLPLLLLAALLAWIVRTDPVGSLRGGAPPVEDLVFARVTLSDGLIRATVVNNGPDPVRIAQVTVDEAYWSFHQEPPGPLSHLARATVEIPYPWVVGEAHELVLVTATGVTVPYAIDVAVETPRPSGRFFGLFALIGAYVGVLPVALGLLWYPLLRRLGAAGRDFVLALTIGLLVFLFVDTFEAGREAAAELASSFHGPVLFALTAVLAYLAIEAFGAWLRGRRTGEEGRAWAAALLVAVGIGLHNFGEGLAVGAAFGLGELALGTLLILGFTLHNTTEGLAIVAPLARTRVSLRSLLVLGLVAGVPTIPGAWLGAFTYSTLWSVVFLAIGAGAIAQVVVQIARGTAGDRRLAELLASPAVFLGLLSGFAVMYVTGLVVG
jgi:hypothetical protein